MPKVFIIILNWNKWEDTIECLQSVYAMEYTNFEVIVIDNASENDSVQRIKSSFPELRLIENKINNGFTGGNNQGMKIAVSEGADYVWLLNNDTVVETLTLSSLVDLAEQSDDIGMVSPTIYYYDDPNLCQFMGSKVDWQKPQIVYPTHSTFDKSFYDDADICLWGTALLINKLTINRIGYLREDYFAYNEDEEYCLRAIKANLLNKVCFESVVYHKNPLPSENKEMNDYYYYYRIRNDYFRWVDSIEGLNRNALFKKIALNAIARAQAFKLIGRLDLASACHKALYDAFKGVRGQWNRSNKMPRILTFILLWHPYLFLNLFSGDIKSILGQIVKRFSQKFRLNDEP